MNGTGRMKKDAIRLIIGHQRLYELFCVDCNAVLMTECSNLQALECDKCGRMYGYRLPKEVESACFQIAMTNPTIQ